MLIRNNELLKHHSINITDVAMILKTTRRRASEIVKEIRFKFKDYYKSWSHGQTGILPLHLHAYLHLSREEMIKLIYST